MTRRLQVSLPLAGLALGLTGCALAGAPTAEVGECVQMSDLEEAEIDSIPTVDCREEHDGEVVATFEGPDGDYPSAEEWQVIIREGCTQGFEDYVGVTYEDSELTLRDLSPTKEGWEADDRSVLCLAYLDGETTTESFEGAKI